MKNLKIQNKILLLVFVIIVFTAISIFSGIKALSLVKEEAQSQFVEVMLQNQKAELKAITDSVATTMGVAIKDLNSKDEIFEKLRALNTPIRFFDNNTGYFFIYDSDGINISHPINPALVGKNLIDLKDKNGVYVIKDLIAEARNGGGFVTFFWPKPPTGLDVEKLSYGRMIPGTDYMIGTGIYLDDILQEKALLAQNMDARVRPVIIWSSVILISLFIVLVLPMVFLLIRQMVRPLKHLYFMAEDLAQGRLAANIEWDSKDEIGDLARSLSSMATHLNGFAKQTAAIAEGNLTIDVIPASKEDILGNALLKMSANLRTMVAQIQNTSNQISAGCEQVADSSLRLSQQLSQGTTQAAAAVKKISSSMGEIGTQTSQSAENAEQANLLSDKAKLSAEHGSKKMASMITAMDDINNAAEGISKIIKVIDEIAFQTNLLALNAAVEAARAGQHGKGFAVVAEEVRNLAGRSAKAAEETTEMIQSSIGKTRNGTQIAEDTAEALTGIVDNITKVSDLVDEIAAATKDQAGKIDQINQGLGQIDQSIQRDTENAEESAATSKELSGQAAYLRELLQRFKLKDNTKDNQTNLLR
jgi:methyl-accepting chemotaxis protein